ncbi:MAG: UvrD-helicase domain-containing protein [Candidatus Paceibacterota bacterium]|jgi:DNA helicase-2/ATP-dependent DNA helicase PcrA
MNDFFDDLNEKQREAATAPDGPILVVAGAGSGKTKTLTARLVFLITHRKVSPERILAITFTNKAAGEMKRRVADALAQAGVSGGEPFVSTFHAFGAWVLRREAGMFGRTNGFTIFDADDAGRAIKRVLKNRGIDPKKISPAQASRLFGKIKNEFLSADAALGTTDDALVWALFSDYERYLEANNGFDFDDLIYKVIVAWQKDPAVLARYQSRFSHVLIDEYQDTNPAQHALASLVARTHGNIMAVGDDAQAIYGFRSSDFRNFLDFEKTWPGTRIIFLEQNYRSTQSIVAASSGVIARNQFQKRKTLWTENSQGAPLRVVEHADEFDQAEWIVDAAAARARAGALVGILYRTNAQSRALEQMLLEKEVPYALFGAMTFYERKEVKDILAVLRVAVNANDQISGERLEKTFPKKITRPLREALAAAPPNASPADYIKLFLHVAQYRDLIKKEFANYADRYENIAELIYFAEQFASLPEFLEKVTLASPLDGAPRKTREEKSAARIHLMTIHLAKGLEFDDVCVAGVSEGLMPHQRSLLKAEDLEEERRLMYVAMTRARQTLSLHFYQIPSRFLYEVPPETVIFEGDAARTVPGHTRDLDDEERYIEYD